MNDPIPFRRVRVTGPLHVAPKRVSIWREVLTELVLPVAIAGVLVYGLVWWLIR